MTSTIILGGNAFDNGVFNAFTNKRGSWPDMLYIVSFVA